MIDPSLLFARNTIGKTLDLAREYTESYEVEYSFYYPLSLQRLIDKPTLSQRSDGINFYLRNAAPVAREDLIDSLKEYSNIVSAFVPTDMEISKHRKLYDILSEELERRGEHFDEELRDILFEEWVFLQEHSWIVSRIKKPFNRFVAAGGVCVQFGNRPVDVLVRRTLHSEHDELISVLDRLRAFGKWIAVGVGAQVLSPISPWLSGLPALFLLFDPIQSCISDSNQEWLITNSIEKSLEPTT